MWNPKYLGVVFLLLFALASGCSDGENAANGDQTGEPNPVGGQCEDTSDCQYGLSCQMMGLTSMCTQTCASDAECLDYFYGGCCKAIGDGFYCATNEVCDADTPAPGTVAAGGECTASGDCVSGLDCVNFDGVRVCTMLCMNDAGCAEDFPNGCCKEAAAGKYCATEAICDGTATPADGDEDGLPTEQDNMNCEPDTYRCADNLTVERCGVEGEWGFYKKCSGETQCYAGDCVSECSNEEDGLGCCPDSYRCRGTREVQRCVWSGNGYSWEFYRDCQNAEICVDGECHDFDPNQEDGDMTDQEEDTIPQGAEECTSTEECPLDHYCFIMEGEEVGYCKPFCDEPGGRCPRGYTCERGQCVPMEGFCRSDAECGMNQFCDIRPGQSDGICMPYCFEMGQYCPLGCQCDENEGSINYGKCLCETDCEACSHDGMCSNGYYCDIWPGQMEGCCIEMCGSDEDCAGNLVCGDDGRCVPGNRHQDCGGPCPPGHVCDQIYGECALNCPPCPENHCCDSASAPNCYECVCENPLVCGWGLRACCFGYSCSAIVYGVLGFCI